MTKEQWAGVEAHFAALHDVPEQDRAAKLAEIADPEVRQEVASLLKNARPGEAVAQAIGATAVEIAAGPVDGKASMPLSTGDRLGPYEILAPIGAGGMGEVYKARDTRLGRLVALKISKAQFSERFEREASAVAALNHPNICQLYDVGPNYLVMEFVDGVAVKGPLPLEEALRLAGQIADALEAAHEKGITHRDLKPGNILVKADGSVKVLDFGLAKVAPVVAASPLSEHSPTITMDTQAGLILGTAAYMSPEQARGKHVGPRADIWAFGVVLYEILIGRRLFQGEDLGDTLAAVVKEQPDFSLAPHQVRRLLEACLEKDPKKRLGTIGNWRLLLDASEETAFPRSRLNWVAWSVTGLAILAAAALAFVHFREKAPAATESVRFEIAQPANVTFTNNVAISPDGRKLAFIASSTGTAAQIWVRSLNAVEARPLAGTENAGGTPFWSPDSRYIAFSAQGKLQKIEASGGPALTLCNHRGILFGGFWTRDNKLVYGTNSSGLFQVNAAGGAPSVLTSLTAEEVTHVSPTLMPDGRHFLYGRAASISSGGIYLGSLDAKPNEPPKKLLPDTSIVAYVPSLDPDGTVSGYLLFVRGGTLMAQPFDNQRLNIAGEAVPIAERVPNIGGFSASTNGALVFRARPASPGERLTWFDRKGNPLGGVGDPSTFAPNSPVALSPDGKRAAFARTDPESGNTDIWLYEFARGLSSRFTFDPGAEVSPVWSPDGRRMAFGARRSGAWGIYEKASDLAGGEELLYKSPDVRLRPSSWSRDGRFLLYSGEGTGIWMLPVQAPPPSVALDVRPQTLSRPEFGERDARFSPDGRYIAYISNSSGKDEVYVRPFDGLSSGAQPVGGTSMVSKDGGEAVRWRGGGREIFYWAQGGDLMSVEVSTTPVFKAGVPKPLFKAPTPNNLNWDVASDGERFLFAVPVGQNSASAPYTVVLNWQAALKR